MDPNTYEPAYAQLINILAPAVTTLSLHDLDGTTVTAEEQAEMLTSLQQAIALIRTLTTAGYRLTDTPRPVG